MNDVFDELSQQLPEGIRHKIKIMVMPYILGELPDIVISDGKGREWQFTLEQNNKIPDLIISRLCLEVG